MSSRPSASKRLKALAREIPDDRITDFHLAGLEEIDLADHAAATMGATLVEKALEVAILSRLAPLSEDDRKRLFDYEHRGPLCDLSARITMGRALGLYGPKTVEDLTRIREIRNAFAHSLWLIRFSFPEVSALCEFNVSRFMTIATGGPGDTPRAKYLRATKFLARTFKSHVREAGLGLLARLPAYDKWLP
jgi:hypothetical protein